MFGHSIPAGGGATDPELGYATLVGAQLGIPVENHSHGGDTSEAVLEQVKAQPVPGPADLVILHVGMNDILMRGDEAVARGTQPVGQAVGRLSSGGARLVLVQECRPESFEHEPPYDRGTPEVWQAWNAMLTTIADGYPHVLTVDACATWDPFEFTDAAGGYHPSDAGHAFIAERIVQALASPAA